MLCLFTSVAESVRRPLGNLYKLDGKYGTAYSEKKRKGPAAGRPSRPGDPPSSPSSSSSSSGRQPDGVAGRMQKNVHVSMVVHVYNNYNLRTHT